jgi:hypothetical protein
VLPPEPAQEGCVGTGRARGDWSSFANRSLPALLLAAVVAAGCPTPNDVPLTLPDSSAAEVGATDAGCTGGNACALAGQPCRVGLIDCSSGKPVCVDSGSAGNGTGCGSGMVCQDGACGACKSGGACTPTNRCHQGTLDCGTGACTDSGTPVPPGASCGSNLVCSSSGACTACSAGATCDVKVPCKAGKYDCSTGAQVCVMAGNADNGTACGTGMVCSDGACTTCTAGADCTPSGNSCKTGKTSCTAGSSVCMETGNVANGQGCGAGRVCNAGSCQACTEGATCPSDGPCRAGKTSCTSGSAVCVQSNVTSGMSCPGAGDKVGTCSGGNCNLACPKGQNDCGSNRCAVCCTQCCGNADCSASQICSGGTCHALDCSTCETASAHACNPKTRFTPCGSGYCDAGTCQPFVSYGSSCSNANQCPTGICGSGETGKVCCMSSCGIGEVCNNKGLCKLVDGEACDANGNNQCLHQCVNACLNSGTACLTNFDCPSLDSCLTDAPNCAKFP